MTYSFREEHDYYGAIILKLVRELRLQIETWPRRNPTFGGGDLVTLRFGAIVNYEEVQRFFIKVPTDGLHHLRALDQSSAHKHVIEMEFDRTGDRIQIIAGSVSELAREST